MEEITWRILYMQALGPPEKATNTNGHGLILSSCTSKTEKAISNAPPNISKIENY